MKSRGKKIKVVAGTSGFSFSPSSPRQHILDPVEARPCGGKPYDIRTLVEPVGSDPRADFIRLYQVRRLKSGWQRRVVDSGWSCKSPRAVEQIDTEESERLWVRAEEWERDPHQLVESWLAALAGRRGAGQGA